MKVFEERLELESAEWVKAGLLRDDQRASILQRHSPAVSSNARFIGIVATVGGLLFAVGVSLIIKSNWEMIGAWAKIFGLVALLVGAYAVGWKLKVVDQRLEKTGDAFLMVGGILFLCGIALVSQIFHLNSRPATGVMVWWIGIVAVPWMARAKGAQFLSIVAALVWLGKEMTTPGSWIEVAASASNNGHNYAAVGAVFFLLGTALWLGGLALRDTKWSEFASLHEKWGLLVSFGSLYWLSFARHYWLYRHRSAGVPDPTTILAVGLAVLLVAITGFGAWRSSAREVKSLAPWFAIALVPVFGVFTLVPSRAAEWWWSGLAWVTLFVLSIGIVRTGLETAREGWVNLGIMCIAVNVITRYFDLFGSMLEGGVFFIVTGVLVTGLGFFLEKKRRSLVAVLRTEARS